MRGSLSWVLLTLSCPYIVTVFAEQITLWQFGAPNRLYRGLTTLPLVPVGTAPDGAATSYDYVFVNNVVTKGSTVVSTETRDLIASASGWYDIIPGGDLIISCALIGSGETYGACYNVFPSSTVLANSGVASAIVLEVSGFPSQTTTTVPSSTTDTFSTYSMGFSAQSPLPTATFASSSSTSSPSPSTRVPSGAIAGIVAGVVVTAVVAVALWVCCLRKRRPRSSAATSSQDAEMALRPIAKELQEPTTARPFLPPRPFTALPGNKYPGRPYPTPPVASVSTWELDDRTTADSSASASSAFSPEKTASDSEIGDEMSTAQLLSALYRRVESDPRVSEGLGALARRHMHAELDGRSPLGEIPPPVYTESVGAPLKLIPNATIASLRATSRLRRITCPALACLHTTTTMATHGAIPFRTLLAILPTRRTVFQSRLRVVTGGASALLPASELVTRRAKTRSPANPTQ
uniref:Transmembrane protein n=1 Tax=Mycena chlorophos TaxID=658473 RepID=A0ABQ0L291_MYCCL|nr:predicted protein [Mycena chlorophos]